MPKRPVPPTASIANPGDGAKLVAPSAERNTGPLCDLLREVAPKTGRAIEIASGTGQHIIAFARCLPGLHWLPTDIDPTRHDSIDAYVAESGLSNIARAETLDAGIAGWGADHARTDLIVIVNLLHLISTPEAQTLISEAAHALVPGGTLLIYGPFQRAGELTSDSDKSFDTSLRAQDPEIGYKDDFDTMDMMQEAGLEMALVVEMPANNLSLVARKP
ncbi:DUF938 domain-containing protein [Arenibacterium sp. CAU 1754]